MCEDEPHRAEKAFTWGAQGSASISIPGTPRGTHRGMHTHIVTKHFGNTMRGHI